MTLISAVSPNKGLVAIHSEPKDSNNNNNTNKRLLIKCYDSSVSLGTLKFTLSASLKDELSINSQIQNLHFTSNECLLANLSNGHVLIFDLNRGVHSQTIHVKGNTNGEVCDVTGKDNLIYSLIKKEGKTVVFVHDVQQDGKIVKKIKSGSCDDDDRLGLAIHNQDMVAVCIGKKIKVINKTGETVSKCKIKSNDEGKASFGENKTCCLHFSSDGMVLLASTPTSVHLFAVGNGKGIGVFRLSEVSSINFHTDGDKSIAAIVSNKSKVSLLEIGLSSKKKNSNIEPFATIALPTHTTENQTIINDAFFLSGKKGASDIMILELTPRGINNVDVGMTKVSYRNDSSQLQSGELYPKSSNANDNDEGKSADTENAKKRKAPSTNVVLGPGESGGEAMTVTDQTAMKRLKTTGEDEDEDDESGDDFELEEGDEEEETIAQRLALLSSELDRDTEDEEELLKIQNGSSSKFLAKTATSDSLAILLRQSLMANDDTQLEVALQVTDKRVIENSILGLASDISDENDDEAKGEIIIMLLTKLVTRLSRKPSRAQRLAFWIRTVLVALISKIGSSSVEMGKAEREIASRLGPLRNLLSERVESLPELLRLEGRLSLLNSQL